MVCAVEGAELPGDFKIKKTKLRGQSSEGMLCSFSELGIESDANGIIELPQDAPIGTNLRDYLKLDDNAIEISLTFDCTFYFRPFHTKCDSHTAEFCRRVFLR